MRGIRDRLTYANVVSTLALFLVLAGGAAYAARVAKKSVGSPQLKANAVTTAKIKANAITTRKIKRNAVSNAKIKDGAVESEKIANGGVTGQDIDLASTPFGRVVHRAKGTAIQALGEEPALYPLGSATYAQAATESDSFVGALDVTFSAACATPRKAVAVALLDAEDPLSLSPEEIVAYGELLEPTGSATSKTRVELGPAGVKAPTRFEPGSQESHRISMVAFGVCASGSGISASFGGLNVVGVE